MGYNLIFNGIAGGGGSSYSKTYTVTIDHTECGSSDSTNFPVLVSISDSTLKTTSGGGLINNTTTFNGQTVPADLIFSSDSAGSSLYKWDVQSYDSTSGILNVWVKIPTVSHTDNTVFYLNYGNASVTTYQGGAVGDVYGTSYKAVYHLADGTTLNLHDSSPTGNTLTNNNSTGTTTGKFDGAGSFAAQASNQYLNRASPTGFPTGTNPREISCWFKMGANQIQEWFGYGDNAGGVSRFAFYWQNDGKIYIECSGHSASFNWTYDTNWHKIVAKLPSGTTTSNITCNFDGVDQTMTGDGATLNTTNTEVKVGGVAGYNATTTFIFTGTQQECRVYAGSHSTDWSLTEYNNQNNPGNIGSGGFLTFS